MAQQFYHIACLDENQADSLGRGFISASLGNISGFKAVAIEDASFPEWQIANVITYGVATPLSAIQKLFDLSGYVQAPFVAIMPIFSSSGAKLTSCRLYQFEDQNDFLINGWKVPAIDGNPIQPSKAPFVDVAQGVSTISANGGLLYFYDTNFSQNSILS
jgi:hypothetical protein